MNAENRNLLTPSPSLTARLVNQLRAEIVGGRLPVGAQIPTEAQLMKTYGVSRTVVREAVAALRAEGLVNTRQGRGAFVTATTSGVPFQVTPEEASSLKDILNILELRATLEMEACALAAERRSPDDLARIGAALAELDRQIEAGADSVDADFDFHVAVAEASGNPYFPRLLQSLGVTLIPRRRIEFETPAARRAYVERVQQEHRAIETALAKGDAAAARRAMEKHLSGSRYRLRLRLGEDAATLPEPAPRRPRRKA
ncbi:FadR family transcriptional regulator [Alsobacter sp. SYSU M60028]|uniref:FadR family transcriptional regulator n=1 Tax=Alsobacter ponti TaxID=2962936 RepID=A0ABT1LCK6_9HYPH|nr:FadR/GntR family transcriptional regulator [Alsobacter ponti]MCP8937983.1 FadR family transcriptional regulator [Alsobacter ponti]